VPGAAGEVEGRFEDAGLTRRLTTVLMQILPGDKILDKKEDFFVGQIEIECLTIRYFNV
jgi:hypothetical protein